MLFDDEVLIHSRIKPHTKSEKTTPQIYRSKHSALYKYLEDKKNFDQFDHSTHGTTQQSKKSISSRIGTVCINFDASVPSVFNLKHQRVVAQKSVAVKELRPLATHLFPNHDWGFDELTPHSPAKVHNFWISQLIELDLYFYAVVFTTIGLLLSSSLLVLCPSPSVVALVQLVQNQTILISFSFLAIVHVFFELAFQCFRMYSLVLTKSFRMAVNNFVAERDIYVLRSKRTIGLIKTAEVASRGYCVGPFLPPIGRIEKNSANQHPEEISLLSVQCLNIRRILLGILNHLITDLLEGPSIAASIDILDEDYQLPSLFLSSLVKRNNWAIKLTNELLITHFEILFRSLLTNSYFTDISSFMKVLRLKQEKLTVFNLKLEKTNNLMNLRQIHSEELDNPRTKQAYIPKQIFSAIQNLNSIALDMRGELDTNSALFFACQHDISTVTASKMELKRLQKKVLCTRDKVKQSLSRLDALCNKWGKVVEMFDDDHSMDDDSIDCVKHKEPESIQTGECMVDKSTIKENLLMQDVNYTKVYCGISEHKDEIFAAKNVNFDNEEPSAFGNVLNELTNVLNHRELPPEVIESLTIPLPTENGNIKSKLAIDKGESRDVPTKCPFENLQQELSFALQSKTFHDNEIVF